MAGVGDIKLLGTWASPFAIRTRIALGLKNIRYEFIEEDLKSKSEFLIKSNPIYKKIPVLIHNGKCICESLIIIEYIDDTFSSGPSLLHSDPYDRATSRFWAAYVDTKWFRSWRYVMKAKTEEERNAAMEEVKTGMGLVEEVFEKMSEGKGFFGGEKIGYLDIALGSWLPWIGVAESVSNTKCISKVLTPGLHSWAERFLLDAAAQDVMPEAERCMEFALMTWSAPKLSIE